MTSSRDVGDDATLCGRRVTDAWTNVTDWWSSCTGRLRDAVDRARDDGQVFADDGRCSTAAGRLVALARLASAGCRRLVGRRLTEATCGSWRPEAANLRQKLGFCRAVVAEFVGTFFLVVVGCGSATERDPYTPGQLLQQDRAIRMALAFGITYTCSLYCLRRGTDGHFNPAVTVALTVLRRVSITNCICFVLAQFFGALSGSAVLRSVTPVDAGGLLGCTVTTQGVGRLRGLSVEFVGTLMFVFVVCAGLIGAGDECCASVESTIASEANSPRPVAAPFVAGATLSALSLFAMTYTGASFNTARSFGTAVFANVWTAHWIYWFGPVFGGLAGAKLYDVIFINSPTGLDQLKVNLRSLARRLFTRRPAGEAAKESQSEAGPVDLCETVDHEERRMWRRNSAYSTRSVLVDRGVQSTPTGELLPELTAKSVAEDCLTLTTTAIAVQRPADIEETDPSEPEMDPVLPGSTSGGSLHRSDSYQQAITQARDDSTHSVTDSEHGLELNSPEVDAIQQSTLETVCELEEPDALNNPTAEAAVEGESQLDGTLGSSFDEAEAADAADGTRAQMATAGVPDNKLDETATTVEAATLSHADVAIDDAADLNDECDDEELCGRRASSTVADMLEDISENVDGDLDNNARPVRRQMDNNISQGTSEEDDCSVMPDAPAVKQSSLDDIDGSDNEFEEDTVWVSGTSEVLARPANFAPEKIDINGGNSIFTEDRHVGAAKSSSPSPPPPPPFEVVAVEAKKVQLPALQPAPESVPGEVMVSGEQRRSNADGEYCHSPLGGAMPESDSSGNEFVFP